MFDELFEKSGLSLDRLLTLCEVAEKGSIGEATKGDSNRQTQFSRQISELEKFFGVELLNRESRPHRLSDEGRELASLTKIYLKSLSGFQARCGGKPVKLVIGSGESIIQWLLIPMLEHLGRELPEAMISMRNLRTEEIVRGLIEGEIDLGLVRRTAVVSPLKSVGTWEYGYRLFVPDRLKPRESGKLKIRQISKLPLALIEGEGEFRRQLAMLVKDEEADLNLKLECSSYSQIATAVQSGAYCGFLPHFASRHLPEPKFHSYEIEGFESLKRGLVFAWNPRKGELRPMVDRAIRLFKSKED
jgi:DNA-binding transcriptional LysR family regulator